MSQEWAYHHLLSKTTMISHLVNGLIEFYVCVMWVLPHVVVGVVTCCGGHLPHVVMGSVRCCGGRGIDRDTIQYARNDVACRHSF